MPIEDITPAMMNSAKVLVTVMGIGASLGTLPPKVQNIMVIKVYSQLYNSFNQQLLLYMLLYWLLQPCVASYMTTPCQIKLCPGKYCKFFSVSCSSIVILLPPAYRNNIIDDITGQQNYDYQLASYVWLCSYHLKDHGCMPKTIAIQCGYTDKYSQDIASQLQLLIPSTHIKLYLYIAVI